MGIHLGEIGIAHPAAVLVLMWDFDLTVSLSRLGSFAF